MNAQNNGRVAELKGKVAKWKSFIVEVSSRDCSICIGIYFHFDYLKMNKITCERIVTCDRR